MKKGGAREGHGSRLAAVRTLLAVERGADLDRALDRELRGAGLAERRDRALATAIAYAAVRHQARLDALLERAAARKLTRVEAPVRAVLRAAAAQLVVLDGVPEYAAVSSAPDVARDLGAARAAGLVNGVLRGLLRERAAQTEPAESPQAGSAAAIAARESYPGWLVARWVERFGVERAAALALRWNEPAPLALRLAPGVDREAFVRELAGAGFEASPSPWLARAVRVRAAHPAELPGWDEGRFQPQDEASQAVVELLDPEPGEVVLDLCAGLGTKTRAIVERAGGALTVVACDRSLPRLVAQRAERNRLGATASASAGDVRVAWVTLDGAAPLPIRGEPFDRVLVDAPCSGLGAIRRHPEIKWRRGPADPSRLGATQRALLAGAVRVLRPGGVVVYSTCSTEPEENEAVVRAILATDGRLHVEMAHDWLPAPFAPLVGDDGFLRTYPDGEGLDGFFAARIRKE